MAEQLNSGDQAVVDILDKIDEGGYSAASEGGTVHLAKADFGKESFVFARVVTADGSSEGAFAVVNTADGAPEITASMSEWPRVRVQSAPSTPEQSPLPQGGAVAEVSGDEVWVAGSGQQTNPLKAQEVKVEVAQRIESIIERLARAGVAAATS